MENVPRTTILINCLINSIYDNQFMYLFGWTLQNHIHLNTLPTPCPFSQSMTTSSTIISVDRPWEILTSDNVKAFQLSQWNYIISKLRQIQVSTWNPDSKPFISVFTSPQPFVHYRFSKENPDIILRTGPLGDNMLVSERWQVSPWFVTAMMVMTQGWVRGGIK